MLDMRMENEKEKLVYTRPWLELLWFETEDVITESEPGIDTPIDPINP